MARQIALTFAHRFPSGVEVQPSLARPLPPGSVLAIFGPSGAGKTTVLRALAGLLRPASGRIVVDDHVWLDSSINRFEPPQSRRVGYVAQQHTLFPHLTVTANVEYGLRSLASSERRRRVDEVMALVKIEDLRNRKPAELSGGEAQRVTLARALALAPELLLLDEPFGALDDDTRRTLRADVRRVLRETGTSAVLVTHDRVETMAMADELAVMIDGRIRQAGSLAYVFRRPVDTIVARALGVEMVVAAVVDHTRDGLVTLNLGGATLVAVAEDTAAVGAEVYICIRAADVVVEAPNTAMDSARNHLKGVVTAIEHEGAVDRITILCGFELIAAITSRSSEELGLHVGSVVVAAIKATAIHVVPKA